MPAGTVSPQEVHFTDFASSEGSLSEGDVSTSVGGGVGFVTGALAFLLRSSKRAATIAIAKAPPTR